MQTSTSSRVRRYPYQITLSLVLEGFHSPSAPGYNFCLVLLPTLILIDLVPIKFSLHVTIGISDATPVPIFSAPWYFRSGNPLPHCVRAYRCKVNFPFFRLGWSNWLHH
ncbi:BAH_G0048630.mRNA.1.CDS.1 [Saccharomyces cerevisiae]|nr:BAH_G0048630.mRNA.1.CDS.1 [Saccharomyces cerevisiae]CAI7314493.1 BAH_G0048630.mRNA.1.CDS.1 [Saccharomyces cerevisiae]